MSLTTITIPIRGMSCNHCVMRVTKALQGVAGVTSVEVSLEKNNALVSYDSNQATLQQLSNAIKEAGYEPVLD